MCRCLVVQGPHDARAHAQIPLAMVGHILRQGPLMLYCAEGRACGEHMRATPVGKGHPDSTGDGEGPLLHRPVRSHPVSLDSTGTDGDAKGPEA